MTLCSYCLTDGDEIAGNSDDGRENTCQGGGNGVPTVCDVQCAMAYSPFFDECERALRMAFDPATITAFSGLAHTCDTLPVVPLLTSLAGASCPPTLDTTTTGDADLNGFGAWLDTTLDCSLAQLKVSSAAVDTACCPGEGDCTDGSGPDTCTADCGGKLLAMITSCPNTLNLVFDGLGDGVYDGVAQTILNQRDVCLALPASEVTAAIKEKQEDGCLFTVEGVGETQVNSTVCEDIAPRELCSLVGKGVLHCAADFCPDGCAHAAQCDRTCGFCSAAKDGGTDDGKRRRDQIVINTGDTCGPADFETYTNAINDACWCVTFVFPSLFLPTILRVGARLAIISRLDTSGFILKVPLSVLVPLAAM